MIKNSISQPSRFILPPLILLIGGTSALAQGRAFDSPGASRYFVTGQTNQFTNDFNPAIGVVIDFLGDYLDDDSGDGFDLELRLIELNASGYVDPDAWAYLALVSEQGESPEVEEIAVNYTGMEGNSTIKVGRFFVDFGKQMQTHLEELRTLERPLPLRSFLGDELGGDGLQYDNWMALGEMPVRFSVGAFASLLGEDDEDDPSSPLGSVPDRNDIDELSFTARLTGMVDVGDSGLFQLGLSSRFVPEFSYAFEPAALETSGLSNTVYGLDATYGWTGDTGLSRFSAGGEFLLYDGDLAAQIDDPTTPTAINVVADTASGYFLFADYGWNQVSSAGVQYALADLPSDPDLSQSEFDVYYTMHLTELRRLRFGVTLSDGDNGDATRVYVQFTNFFGNHAHGANW